MRLSLFAVFAALFLAGCEQSSSPQIANRTTPVAFEQVSPDAELYGFSASALNQLKQDVIADIEQGLLPGANILIARKGEIIAQYSIGYANKESREPLTPNHLFRLYSMTKPVSAVIALQQIEDGHYTLDTPINTQLPELSNLSVYQEGANQAPDTPVTMRHLLTHTAGFTATWGDNPVAKEYVENGVVEYVPHDFKDAASSIEDLVRRLSDIPLLHQPGTARTYGISNDVQGLFMARVDEVSADQVFANRIATPLAMSDTKFCVDQADSARLTSMYTADEQGKINLIEHGENSAYLCPVAVTSYSGGLVSTITDYYKFAQMLANHGKLDDTQILQPSSIALLSQPQDFVEEGEWIKGADWGLSVAVVTDASKSIRKEVNGNYYWSGSANTSFWVDPSNEIVALMFTQVRNSYITPSLQTRFRNRVYTAFIGDKDQ